MPPAHPALPPKRALPSKEASLFKELLALYETSQYKKAIKTADQILKKFPEHGGTYSLCGLDQFTNLSSSETLAMKGLVISFLDGRREEGVELVRKGIRCDLTSHIVWHVFGLVKKAEKDYEEAVKSYIQALRYDKV